MKKLHEKNLNFLFMTKIKLCRMRVIILMQTFA